MSAGGTGSLCVPASRTKNRVVERKMRNANAKTLWEVTGVLKLHHQSRRRVATEGHPYIYGKGIKSELSVNVGAALRGRPRPIIPVKWSLDHARAFFFDVVTKVAEGDDRCRHLLKGKEIYCSLGFVTMLSSFTLTVSTFNRSATSGGIDSWKRPPRCFDRNRSAAASTAMLFTGRA